MGDRVNEVGEIAIGELELHRPLPHLLFQSLVRGTHHITGRFAWTALPPGLRVPQAIGIVELSLAGQQIARPRRDEGGTLWLREARASAAPTGITANRVEVEVHRRLEDGVPPELVTIITLRVSGEAREELLGVALPSGFAPTYLVSMLPARLDPDGRLRAQVRPGEWKVQLGARQAERGDSFAPPVQPKGARWDATEIWAVALAPQLRLAELEGAPAVDPTQTELPEEWRQLPTFRFEPGVTLKLVEKRRGNEGSAADQLSLQRTWHLDFDAGGATVVDQLTGTLRSSLRLEMGEATALGRAAIGGQDQPITERAGSQRLGVETTLGAIALEADSRVENGARTLPAVSWAHDFESVSATLMIPPGYRLLHASGVDEASPTWIANWDLLAIFFVLLTTVAIARLLGRSTALIALVTLALVWPEPVAPKLVWLALVVAEALRRVATRGRTGQLVRLAHLAVLVALVAVAVPFSIRQLRVGLFPALERPDQSAQVEEGALDAVMARVPMAEPPAEAFAADAVAQVQIEPEGGAPARSKARSRRDFTQDNPSGRSVSTSASDYGYYGKANFAPDPSATVPTGPGRPDWNWEAVSLAWSGPVTQGQQLELWLVPPWLNALLALARVLLVAALAHAFVRAWRAGGGSAGPSSTPPPPEAPAGEAAAAGVSLALVLLMLLASAPARAGDLPTPELLGQLRDALLEPPGCSPSCAVLSRLTLAVAPDRLELRASLDAAAETGVPLPGGGANESAWLANTVKVDGAAASGLRRDAQGVLWLRVARGRHELQLSGPLPPRATIELSLPLAPQRASLAGIPTGWTVVGIRPDGRVSGALQLVRTARAAQASAPGTRLDPTQIPMFVRVTRTLELGLSWAVRTSVERIAPSYGAIVVEVPLLAGESVTTPGVRAERGHAFVTLAPGEAVTQYGSTLAIAEKLSLTAPDASPWTEVWRVEAGPLWHVEAEGLPPIDELVEGARAREWRPWPGEKLTLVIERPEGHAGATLTIDRSQLTLAPGLRATDATLAIALRSSQGGQHSVTLPEGAQLTSLLVNGEPQPLRQEGRRVPLTLAPGSREVTLGWREPRGIDALLRGSAVELGLASVNAHTEIDVPDKRWVLFVGGPRLGPSVMFWSTLAIVAALAWILGRVPWTPLRTQHWLLLGLGLTQAPFAASGIVVAWLLLLGARGQMAARVASLHRVVYSLVQVALVVLTAIAAGELVFAIQHGLLGTPEMRIAGNGSSAFALRWYLDRSAALLPSPWVFSLSIWWYRAAMLAWSLWLAFALVGWARWAFAQWSAGGMFRAEPPAA